MINGSIYITTNPEMVLDLASSHTVVCISGDTANYRDLISASGAMVASILLPPYEASVAEVDNNMQMFKEIYFNHLSNGEAFEYISIMLRALVDGRNILIYLTKSESEMSYIPAFIEYMFYNFGIMIGTEHNQFQINPSYVPGLLDTLLLQELLDVSTYLYLYPAEVQIQNQYAVSKIINTLPIDGGTMEEFMIIVNDMKNKTKNVGNKMTIPVGRIR